MLSLLLPQYLKQKLNNESYMQFDSFNAKIIFQMFVKHYLPIWPNKILFFESGLFC